VNPVIERLKASRDELQGSLDAIVTRHEDGSTPSDEERANFDETRAELEKVDARLREIAENERARREHVARMLELEGDPQERHAGPQEPPSDLSWGEQFIRSDAAADYITRKRGTSGAVEVGPLFGRETPGQLAPIMSSALGIVPMRLPGIVGPAEEDFSVLRLIGAPVPTTSNAIDYLEETPYTSATPPFGVGDLRPPIAEGDPAGKDELQMTFALRTQPVRTIAHWIPVTRQALDDMPTLRAYVDGRLRYGITRKVEAQFLNGTGVGQQILGIRNAPIGTSTHTGFNDDPMAWLEAIIKGANAVSVREYDATGFVMNKADFGLMAIGLAHRWTSLGDRVVTAGADGLSIYGLRVATSNKIPAGRVLVGDFTSGVSAFDRQDTRVLIADQHADFFIRNQYVLLAETRVALATFTPLAFQEVTVTLTDRPDPSPPAETSGSGGGGTHTRSRS
jgi:HK97 family phage major capsid protein